MLIREAGSLLRAFSLAVALLASFVPCGISPVRAAQPQAGEQFGRNGRIQFEALPLERSGQNLLQLRATINGKPALLAIDSGAPVSAIAVNRLEYFGVTPARGDENVPKRV
ncbi:MAG: retropepsin-like domain-containing protein, partial [Verrucomicrobiota bacterium]|nr:retropepsin-like domain-containing protein [Verrucomicrobiota bacterium]